MKDVKFITRTGLKSAKKAARHQIEGYMDFVFFKEEVLQKYESQKNFKVGDSGTVQFGHKWGTFRGVFRVAKGYIGAHLGDLGEGFPTKELLHWKNYNVPPSSVPKHERYVDFRNSIKRMLFFMDKTNQRIGRHLEKFYSSAYKDDVIFNLKDMDVTLNHLKKVINKNTTRDDFQSRIIFLNMFLLESINTRLIISIFNKIDKRLSYSYESLGLDELYRNYLLSSTPKQLKAKLKCQINPLKSLELLKRFLLVLNFQHDVTVSLKIRDLNDLQKNKRKIYQTISKEFMHFYSYKMYRNPFHNMNYFIQHEEYIAEQTKFLKLLNRFRSASAAHGFNSREYKSILKELGVSQNLKDYSVVYEKLMQRLSYDIDHLLMFLIPADPPLIEHYRCYLRDSLNELSQATRYESIFEDIDHYLAEFPELTDEMEKEIRKIYIAKREDKEFLIQLGIFIESLSRSIKDKTQRFADLVLVGYELERALTLAHLGHIIKNSERISDEFFDITYALVEKALKEDRKYINVDWSSQWIISYLISKCPKKLDKLKIKQILSQSEIQFDAVKSYIKE